VGDDEQMTIDERRKYLRRMQERYESADRRHKGAWLDEMHAVTGRHRKSLVRLLAAKGLERPPRQRQRGRTYGAAVEQAVVQIWVSLDGICAERLTPTLVATACQLAKFGELALPPEVEAQLGQIREASVTRLLARHRSECRRLPRPGPKRAPSQLREVPMKRIPWDTQEPGHCEVDLVHHAGASSLGEYAPTLQLVAVATGWSERGALLGRSQAEPSARL
jgi:hypothetical protein